MRELLELQQAQGPWLDCVRTGTPVVNIDLTQTGDRWPLLVSGAVRAGFRAVIVFPLRVGQDVIGVLTLISGEPEEHLHPRDGRILQTLADVAIISLVHHHDHGRPRPAPRAAYGRPPAPLPYQPDHRRVGYRGPG